MLLAANATGADARSNSAGAKPPAPRKIASWLMAAFCGVGRSQVRPRRPPRVVVRSATRAGRCRHWCWSPRLFRNAIATRPRRVHRLPRGPPSAAIDPSPARDRSRPMTSRRSKRAAIEPALRAETGRQGRSAARRWLRPQPTECVSIEDERRQRDDVRVVRRATRSHTRRGGGWNCRCRQAERSAPRPGRCTRSTHHSSRSTAPRAGSPTQPAVRRQFAERACRSRLLLVGADAVCRRCRPRRRRTTLLVRTLLPSVVVLGRRRPTLLVRTLVCPLGVFGLGGLFVSHGVLLVGCFRM